MILKGFLLPLFPKKEYKTIQIRLDAPQAVQKTNKPSKTAPESAPAQETKAGAETQTSLPPAPAQQTLTKSVEELMAEQQQTKKQKKAVDWDNLFGDDSPAATSSPSASAPAQVAKVDALQGSSAQAASNSARHF